MAKKKYILSYVQKIKKKKIHHGTHTKKYFFFYKF